MGRYMSMLLSVSMACLSPSMAQAQAKEEYTVDACRYDQGDYRVGVLCIPRSLYSRTENRPDMKEAYVDTVMPNGVKVYMSVFPYSIEGYTSKEDALERHSRRSANVLTAEELSNFRTMPMVNGIQGPFKGIRNKNRYRMDYKGVEAFIRFLESDGAMINPSYYMTYKGISMIGGMNMVHGLDDARENISRIIDLMLSLEK